MRAWKSLRLISINGSALIFLLVVVDLFLGDWFKPKPPVSQVPASIWGSKIIYDASALTGDPKITYTRDSKGYRNIGDYTNPNVVLTIGGSTTDQRYLSDGDTWQSILDSLFNKKYQFVNGGVDGQSTFGHVYSINNWHSKELAPEKVKAILFYFGINDGRLLDGELNAYDKLQTASPVDQIRTLLGRYSFFYQRMKLLRERLVASKNNTQDNSVVWAGHGRREQPFKDSDANYSISVPAENQFKYYKQLVTRLVGDTRNHFPSSNVIFVQQQIPGCKFLSPIKVIDRHPKSDMDTAKTCIRLGQIYLAQDQAVAALPKPEQPEILKMYLGQHISDGGVYDYVHTNKSGSREIAHYLKKHLPF